MKSCFFLEAECCICNAFSKKCIRNGFYCDIFTMCAVILCCYWILVYFIVAVYQKNLCPTVCQMLVQTLKTAGRQDPSSVPKI